MSTTTQGPSADPAELAKFAALADRWWDPRGPLKTLHDINPLRLEYLEQRITLDRAQVLDVGCGGGLLAEAMAARGAAVTAIDLAEDSLIVARQHAERQALAIDYRCEDVQALADRLPGHYDVVTCMELLEHVPDPVGVVGACARALRPGGAAFFSTLNRTPKSFGLAILAAEYLLGMVPRGTHEYLKLIRPSELAGWCRVAGLGVRELTGLHLNPLTHTYFLGGNVDVNYFLWATSPAVAT